MVSISRTSLFVAFKDSQLTGFVHSCPSRDIDADPTVGEVTAIYVHPDHLELSWCVRRGDRPNALASLASGSRTGMSVRRDAPNPG
jgi:hypothetical protein